MEYSIKNILKNMYGHFGSVFPVTATKILFRKYLGYKLDLKNPKTINAKMQYLKLFAYKDNPLITQCADKYKVREYVKQCGCEEILIPLLGAWNNAAEIDFDNLPNKFVLKCNHGSGTNIICKDKNLLNKEESRKLLNKWMGQDFGKQRVEMSYNHIKRKIIAEELIETENDKSPNDYKIFCSYGKPKHLLVASDRDDRVKYDFFTPEWKWLPVRQDGPNKGEGKIPCPNNFSNMLEYASKLSKPFPLVRVDFYNENNTIYFGELTFLDSGGFAPFDPIEYDQIFGDLITEDIRKGIII